MPKTKIYGAKGYFEWHPVINVGKARFCPHFVGGTVDKNGVTPARYKSTNKVEQMVIESSDLFKHGNIEVLCEYGEDETSEETSTEQSEQSAELQKVEFSCVSDAANYLNTKFGVPTYKLRSSAAIREIGISHGLDITINK